MSNRKNSELHDHLNDVTAMKEKFLDELKGTKKVELLTNYIEKMRYIHGCAIYDDQIYKLDIVHEKPTSIPHDDFIRLSKNASILFTIHKHIMMCETKLIDIMESTRSIKNNNQTNDKKNKYMDLNINDIKTGFTNFVDKLMNYEDKIATNLKPTLPDIQAQLGGNDEEIEMELDVTKPTIINYWADWCGPSNRFLNEWNKFKQSAKKLFPHLQVQDLNVENDNDKKMLAKENGVNSFPTIILYNNGKRYKISAGGLSFNDLVKWIDYSLTNPHKQ